MATQFERYVSALNKRAKFTDEYVLRVLDFAIGTGCWTLEGKIPMPEALREMLDKVLADDSIADVTMANTIMQNVTAWYEDESQIRGRKFLNGLAKIHLKRFPKRRG